MCNLGEFKREVEYLDPGLPVEAELVEQPAELEPVAAEPQAAPVKV